jgi:hypothetical protein
MLCFQQEMQSEKNLAPFLLKQGRLRVEREVLFKLRVALDSQVEARLLQLLGGVLKALAVAYICPVGFLAWGQPSLPFKFKLLTDTVRVNQANLVILKCNLVFPRRGPEVLVAYLCKLVMHL